MVLKIYNSLFAINIRLLQVHTIAINKKTLTPINQKIVADEVILIDLDGTKLGSKSIKDALDYAYEKKLDLVQVSAPNATPVVCKIMDYGKHVFSKKKNATSSKAKTKKTSLKEIKFRPSTDIGDFNVKLKKIKSFINHGDKTKISVRFRGREILNSNMGLELLDRLQKELINIAQVEQEPSLEGRQLQMILSPMKKKQTCKHGI